MLGVVEDLLALTASAARVQGCLKTGERHPGPCKGWRGTHISRVLPHKKPKLAQALTPSGKKRPATPQELAVLREGFEGTFGGLRTTLLPKTVESDAKSGRLSFIGQIHDPATGNKVGDFFNEIYQAPDGSRHAVHKVLTLKTNHQGQGFAKAFNAHNFDWYREHGIGLVHLNADIDVGGYAWAREGYDWERHRDAQKIAARISQVHRNSIGLPWPGEPEDRPQWERIPADRLHEQLTLTIALRERLMERAGFGQDDFPTPYEVSELGRWPGAGRDDWWIGKVIMMGSDWNGVTPV